jgi:hypothetical protein
MFNSDPLWRPLPPLAQRDVLSVRESAKIPGPLPDI